MPDTIQDQVEISDVEALKALSDPMRMSLLLAMTDEAKTVKTLAAELDVPPTRLYYHVNMLASHGLIRVVSTRMVSGIEERSYQATARSWGIAAPLLSSLLVRTGVVKALFDMTAAELALALGRSEAQIGEPGSAVPVLVFTRWMLDDARAEQVQARMHQMMDEYGPLEAGEGRSEYHALLTVYRRT